MIAQNGKKSQRHLNTEEIQFSVRLRNFVRQENPTEGESERGGSQQEGGGKCCGRPARRMEGRTRRTGIEEGEEQEEDPWLAAKAD